MPAPHSSRVFVERRGRRGSGPREGRILKGDGAVAMTNEDPTTLAAVLASLMEFSRNCIPGRFTELLMFAELLRSIATVVLRLEDEDELDAAALAFHQASQHFAAVVLESHSMYLLEDEAGAAVGAAQLERALAPPLRRANFLLALSGVCLASLCGDALRRNRVSLSLWEPMIAVASTYPAVGCLAPTIDPDWVISAYDGFVGELHKNFEREGFEIIDLELPLHLLRVHAGALWLKLVQSGPDSATIERTRQLLHRALYFLQSPPDERWILQPYRRIGPTDSLRGILNELLRRDLELRPTTNAPMHNIMEEIFPNQHFVCHLTEGRIRKRQYVILFPASRYFIAEKDERLFKSAAEHPLQWVRDHLGDIPRSLGVQQVRKEVARMEDLQNDENLEAWTKTVAVGMTANAISVALCNSLQLPSEARAFITVFVSSLVLLLRRDPR